jgi:hypothetical protein
MCLEKVLSAICVFRIVSNNLLNDVTVFGQIPLKSGTHLYYLTNPLLDFSLPIGIQAVDEPEFIPKVAKPRRHLEQSAGHTPLGVVLRVVNRRLNE